MSWFQVKAPATTVGLATLAFLFQGHQLHAQTPPPLGGYLAYYDQLLNMVPVEQQSADARGFTLKRDAGELVFQEGRIWLLKPVDGRTIAVAFQGKGIFRFTPPTLAEQERLRDYKKVTTMAEPFTSAVIFFADSTLEELQHRLTFGAGPAGNDLLARTREVLDYMGKDDDKALDPDVLVSLMNGESDDLFYANMSNGGEPWIFMINPQEVEGVRLLARAKRTGAVRIIDVVTQFKRQGSGAAASVSRERQDDASIRSYKIETWLTQDMAADLTFRAAARLEVTSDSAVGPWIAFSVYYKAAIDSVKLDSGQPAQFFKANNYDAMMVRLDHRLGPGEAAPITIYYHGNIIDRYGEWFFVNSSIAWYPVALDGRSYANFDLTFHYPRSLTLSSIGERTDSSQTGTVITTHWVTHHPIRNASFNIGNFQEYDIHEAGLPPIVLLWSYRGHREMQAPTQRNMDQRVGSDVAAALRFFQTVYGDFPEPRFYATEIPDFHGEAFPGMINLSWATFAETSDQGEDEVFRSHEVAHQWWGIGVDYATYHDRWLSEGFADFSGLWFMQTRRGDNKRYFDMLDRWQADIMLRRNDPVPIWLGHRVATISTADDYSAIIYKKGAWVLHMLRMLTLDLQTMKEDRFTSIMHDFYQTYHGGRASTDDFRRVVEKNVGADMNWFFNEWVYGWSIPTYRVAWTSEAQPDGRFKVRFRVAQENVPADFLMYVPVAIDLGGNRLARARLKVTGASSEIDFPVLLPSQPKSVKFNDMEGVLAEVKNVSW